ncbi:hypothetical protein [Aquibacillus albus]|uniref:Phosphoribosylaminoimidazole carboxylase (NCAIR synthetase) n=1 Tax=Aquibacillus albus TaxID=1168171 RepID=A0ABS2N4F8_9BACI|nr:hypothetical protein [Aquibacillus albus]MBM7573025.1 phosphoribosylaminoimidazole carboxylase (NCAIR synthetase) [Aquibacillus albus]
MKKKTWFEYEMENVGAETDSPAVLNDVISTEFEQYPGQNESLIEAKSQLTPSQELIQRNKDGKTWLPNE